MIDFNNSNVSLIGREWIFFKIYTGESLADKLLSEILTISNGLYTANNIDKWFFIRYYDSKFHIRLRFHLTDSPNLHDVIETVNNHLYKHLVNGLIDNIQIDTYIKETERYGGSEGILLAENIFFADSLMICELLSSFEQNAEKEELRWLFGLVNIDRLMSDFNLLTEMKLNFMDNLVKHFAGDFQKDKYLNKQFDTKFKNHLEEINAVLKENKIDFYEHLINKRHTLYRSSISDVNTGIKNGAIHKQVPDLLSSYIHMSCNRLFRTEHRRHEFVLYNLLLRYYKCEFYSK
jgi:thiopeptide-type bacteriocin biosynthesis protein